MRIEALEAAEPSTDLPFAVIGMGKLGARELNVASDLDLMFVYEGEGSETQRAAGQLAERILRSVRDAGWEPDSDLRPEGRNGTARAIDRRIPRVLAALRGDLGVPGAAAGPGDRRRSRPRAALRTERLRRRVPARGHHDRPDRRHASHARTDRAGAGETARGGEFHFKLGIGSLADIQFAVEPSLMRHGGEHPEVRSRRTLEAIDRLAAAKLMSGSVARDLGEAFVFCTDVKNALEMDRRLHAEAVPPNPAEQTALARRLGYEEYPRQSFIDDYLRVTRRARRAMERVFSEEIA